MDENDHRLTCRAGEVALAMPLPDDAHVSFIGRIRTPFRTRSECPKQGRRDGPICRIEIDEPWRPALDGVENYRQLDILYWMHEARRDLIRQVPRHSDTPHGTFALRSPVRPNPIAVSTVDLVGLGEGALFVRGLDCIDGTPLLDIKPHRPAADAPAGSAVDQEEQAQQ